MKKLLIAAILSIGFIAPAKAATGIVRQTVCEPISISTSSPTEITAAVSTAAQNATVGGGNATAGSGTGGSMIFNVKVTNLDTAHDVWCSQDSAVAITGTTHLGDEVAHAAAAPFNWVSWVIGESQKWYCLAATSAVTAEVCIQQ